MELLEWLLHFSFSFYSSWVPGLDRMYRVGQQQQATSGVIIF